MTAGANARNYGVGGNVDGDLGVWLGVGVVFTVVVVVLVVVGLGVVVVVSVLMLIGGSGRGSGGVGGWVGGSTGRKHRVPGPTPVRGVPRVDR